MMIMNSNGEIWVEVMDGWFEQQSAALAFNTDDYIYDPERAVKLLRYVQNFDESAHLV